MAPLSPLDPRRVARGFCDVLLRYVVRPTQGLRDSGHESMGVMSYVSIGMHLGFRGMTLCVFQLQLTKEIGTLPITRDYILDAERRLITAGNLRSVAGSRMHG